jgi:uncharacterized damage-inducible protein DinB
VTIATIAQERILESWQYYQDELTRVIAVLTEEQMSLRLVPGMRSLGEIAEHIVTARALWLPRALGEGDAELEQLEPIARWDEPDDPPRTAAEVVYGLEVTWRLITSRLTRRPADDPCGADIIPDEEVSQLRIVWGLLEHDLHHGGELSFVLGAYGLPAPEM